MNANNFIINQLKKSEKMTTNQTLALSIIIKMYIEPIPTFSF